MNDLPTQQALQRHNETCGGVRSPRTPAYKSGLPEDVTIISINGKSVEFRRFKEVKKMITAITSDPGALLSLVQVTTGQDIRKVLNKAMADESDAMRAEIGLLKTASADKDETMMSMKNTMEKMQEQLDKLTAAISAKDGDEGMTAS